MRECLGRFAQVIDSTEPGTRSGSLDADEFGARHPQLVVCSITNLRPDRPVL